MDGVESPRFAYDVFLSFTWEDVRKSFIHHLRSALTQRGITVFYHDAGLERGDVAPSTLYDYEAIESSKAAIVMFSPKYATSQQCLDELVRIMDSSSSNGLIASLPVFFDVDPAHVRRQSGPYHEAFQAHARKYKGEIHRVNMWRQAMTSAGDLAGFALQYKADGDEAEFIKHVAEDVARKLGARLLDIPLYMVGAESLLVQKINKWLQNGSSQVDVGVIHGLAGIGKTTVAKLAFNSNQCRFESSSFLSGVRTAYGKDMEFIRLQEQFIRDITGKKAIIIDSVPEGRQQIKSAIGTKKILVVLDDVDEEEQLLAIFDCLDMFFSGTKILITSRNQQLLVNEKSIKRFHKCFLNDEESMELFSYHAFGQAYPPQDYTKISLSFIKYCGGLPLALEVVASSLRSIRFEMWEFQYVKLQDYLDKNVFSILKWSFDSLPDTALKDIFLHIAFFMVGRDKDYALKILDGCGLPGKIGLEYLIGKCLVSVDKDNNTLTMHHLIRQMGYEIVRQESPIELGCRGRLSGQNDAYEVLRKKMGTSRVKGLHLGFDISPKKPYYGHYDMHKHVTYISEQIPQHVRPIQTDAFTKMYSLDLLLLENVKCEGGFKDFPKEIKWLLWQGCPLTEISLDFDLDKLVVLEMQKSCLVHAWNGLKYMSALKILNLSHSHYLRSTPDLSSARMLEWISCEDCTNLLEVHESIAKLTNLTYLNLQGCIKLVTLPESNGDFKKLTRFMVKGCRNLRSIPFNMLVSVESLNLDGCYRLLKSSNQVEPSSAETDLKSSSKIMIPTTCPDISSFVQYPVPRPPPPSPSNIFLPSLKELFLANCGISRDDVMEMISWAPSLEYVDLSHNPIRVMSNMNRGPCLKLEMLFLDNCPKLQSVSDIMVSCCLSVQHCPSLKRIIFCRSIIIGEQRQLIEANDCQKVVEMEYRVIGAAVIEQTSEMNEDRARYLGFPGLNTFDYAATDRSFFGRGIYRAGMYSVYLRGDLMAEWFLIRTTLRGKQQPFVRYRVPSLNPNGRPVRALNVGFVGSRCMYSPRIRNVSKNWEWEYIPPWMWVGVPMSDIEEVTWLTHWSVTERRQIQPGDMLEIYISDCESMAIKVIYEEEEWISGGEGEEQDEHKFHCTGMSIDSVSNPSSSNRNKLVNQSNVRTVSTLKDEEEDSVTDVAVWYNNAFRSSDLSVHEVKQETREDTFHDEEYYSSDATDTCDDEEDSCNNAIPGLESLHDCLDDDEFDPRRVLNISTSEDKKGVRHKVEDEEHVPGVKCSDAFHSPRPNNKIKKYRSTSHMLCL